MARYIDAIDIPIPIEDAFYLADFSRTVEWDPGVCEAKRFRTPLDVRSVAVKAFERNSHEAP